MKKYLIKNNHTIPLRIESPSGDTDEDFKKETRKELGEKIAKAINEKQWLRENINDAPDRGYLYCYRNKADGIPDSGSLTQRPLKCGKAIETQWPKRFKTQRSYYDDRGEEVECRGSIRVPFITQVDSYVKRRLQYWKLPSRDAYGGTEWYYISLQTMTTIWSDAKAYAIEEGRKHGLIDVTWYDERVALP